MASLVRRAESASPPKADYWTYVMTGWIGAISLYVAVFILTIAVAIRDRPAAAPADVTGDFGWQAFGTPDFFSGLAASTVIFISSSGHSAFIPM